MTQSPSDPTQPKAPPIDDAGLDAAQQSLSDALRVSFFVLKVLMVLLMLVYIGSGIFRVEEQNTAVRYRFGERVGTYGPGWHFGLPFPIERVVRVPLTTQSVGLDKAFWYNNPEGLPPEQLANNLLDPTVDSFLITGDGNVVHVQFAVQYVIKKREASVENYLRNVGSLERANELVKAAAQRGMIHAIASAKIGDMINKNFNDADIKSRIQQVLDDLDSGITVQSIVFDNKNQSMPNQVRAAYEAVTQAQSDKVRAIQEARRTYDETLGRTAGGAHVELLAMVRAYEAALGNEQAELAMALRRELDRSIRELRLPEQSLLDQVQAYQDAMTAVAGSEDEGLKQAEVSAGTTLLGALDKLGAERKLGRPITGEIAAAVSRAHANRSAISTQARLDYERYASALQAYRKTPLVLANDRLQATRETVMSGLVQNIVGPIGEYRTNPDPEIQEEIAEAELEQRKERARREKEAKDRR